MRQITDGKVCQPRLQRFGVAAAGQMPDPDLHLRGVRLPENGALIACCEQARNLHRARLDPEIEKALRARLPHLFPVEAEGSALATAEA